MTKRVISTFAKSLGDAISKNSPTILTGIAVAGLVGTVIFTVKATPKALFLVEQRKEELNLPDDEPMKPLEYVKTAWRCYIPTAAIGCATIACIIGSNSINSKRTNALATAYGLTQAAFREYKSKVVETIGERKEKGIRDAIAQDKLDKDPVSNKEILIIDKGSTLCYDAHSGRYFKSDIDRIKKAENALNKQLLYDMYISLNEFYYEIGLGSTKVGNDLGWHIDNGFIELYFSSHLADDSTPCLAINYSLAPKYGFTRK